MGDTTRRQLHFHGALSGLVREEQLFGRDHLVAPVVMVREMVLPQGRDQDGELLPAEEIEASAQMSLWEGRPVTIGHPEENGRWISAGQLEAAEASEIGSLRNVEATENGALKLRGEAWIDVQKAERLEQGREILDALRQFLSADVPSGARPIEVSTGYWASFDPTPGKFNGERFRGKQRSIMPDHLAVLPNGVGKCSLEDGCGMPRLNAGGDPYEPDDDGGEGDPDDTMPAPATDESMVMLARRALVNAFRSLVPGTDADPEPNQSDRGLRERLGLAADSEFGDDDVTVWVEDVFSDEGFFVFERRGGGGDSGLFRADFTVDEDGELTVGEPVAVQKQTTYEPVGNAGGESEERENTMTRQEMIQQLLECDECPFTEERLNEMKDGQLLLVAEARGLENVPEALEDPEGGDGDDDSEDQPASAAAGGEGDDAPSGEANAAGEDDVIPLDKLPPEVREVVANARREQEQERDQIMARLRQNDRCQFTDEQLEEFSLEALQSLERSLSTHTYGARGGAGRGSGTGGDYFEKNPRTPAIVTRNVGKRRGRKDDDEGDD